jgi:hypothetical protein
MLSGAETPSRIERLAVAAPSSILPTLLRFPTKFVELFASANRAKQRAAGGAETRLPGDIITHEILG